MLKGKTLSHFLLALLMLAGFSLVFIAANNFVLRRQFAGIVTLSAFTAVIPIPREQIQLPAGFVPPVDLQIERGNTPTQPERFLPDEEVALIGAQCIWEMFETDLSHHTLFLFFSEANDFSGRELIWGDVFQSPEDIGLVVPEYTFLLDALTGERVDILGHTAEWENLGEIIPYLPADFENLPPTILYPDYEEALEAAMEFARRHFNQTQVVRGAFSAAWPIHVIWNAATQEPTIPFALTFQVLDERNRVATIIINSDTLELISLSTRFNDFMPSGGLNSNE
ncbi:MAG: hypothetical protein FWF59_04775 [Turicibacter sp.]|nr:hypothetical protein [Turicibacter sp.]